MARKYTHQVRWTDREIQTVVHEVAQRLEGASRKSVTSRTMLRLIRSVQEDVLPKERHRVLTSHFNFANILPQLDHALKNYEAPMDDSCPDVEEPAPQPTTLLDPKAELFAMLDKFIDAIAYRVADVIEQRAQAKIVAPAEPQVIAMPEPVAKHVATYNPTAKMSKLSIGVIGLLNNQQHVIASKFGNVCFKFFDKKLPKQLPSVDYMIGMVGFLSHLTDGNASKAYGIRYRRISNGMSSLQDVVSDLLKGYVSTEKKS